MTRLKDRIWRILIGPRAQDRVLALDTLYINAMLFFLTLGIRTGSVFFFEAAIVVAMLGFGFWGRSRTQNSSDYLVAGRRLGPLLFTGTGTGCSARCPGGGACRERRRR